MQRTLSILMLGMAFLAGAPPSAARTTVEKTAGSITIGNEYLSRSFGTADNRLTPGAIVNRRTATPLTLEAEAGSEEFVLRYLTGSVDTGMDRTGWTATASSQETSGENGAAANLLDGNASTIWHSSYSSGKAEPPHWVQLDMKQSRTLRSVGWMQRPSGNNGMFLGYKLYAANSTAGLTDEANLVAEGTLKESASLQWIVLDRDVSARYLRLVATSTRNDFGSGAEIYVSDHVPAEAAVPASALTLQNVTAEETAGGQRIVFDMAPCEAGGIDWDIDMVVEMNDGDPFMRKYLRIAVPEEQRSKARIDCIDMESRGVAAVPADNRWTHAANATTVGGLNAYLVTLGQPVYVQGLYLGSEFPETENLIEDNTARIRYYSGKSLTELEAEGRLTDGRFTTWKNVTGATRSATDLNVIRTDFFAYIQGIARPTKLRMQYNSWYDWMLWIDEEKINTSFLEIERGFTSHGVRPMDSYVVDDGWNAYGNDFGCSIEDNTTGFWQFNSKFPNGLEGASRYAHKLGSEFGVWLGPRGGYNFNGSWGQYLEQHGTGTLNRNGWSAVTGDRVYIAKLEEFFLKCQQDYGVNYWKLDGFIDAVPQPSTNERYITGGNEGMYYVTEHWERWALLLEKLYTNSDKDLWINLTCYVNPSPWMLQFCNSIWLQNSTDMGRSNVGGRTRELDQLLSYRDGRYYDFYNISEYQLPPANIFNHDPIYGKENCVAPNSMTDEEFRTYLYFMAARGTAFWEMLWSYTMLDEGNKWMVNAEALRFLEDNFETLRHSVLFGGSPTDGECYGYSCWNGNDGILAVRNPSNSTKSMRVELNSTLGVPESATALYRSLVMRYDGTENNTSTLPYETQQQTYAYGSTLNISLRPGEVRMWKFSTEKDDRAAGIVTASANDAGGRLIEIVLDEPIRKPAATCFKVAKDNADYTTVSAVELMPDYRTLRLTTKTALEADGLYTVTLENVADWVGNTTAAVSPAFHFNPDALVKEAVKPADFAESSGIKTVMRNDTARMVLSKPYALTGSKCVRGCGDFTVSLFAATTLSDATLVQQEGGYELSLRDGKPVFRAGGAEVMADERVNDGKEHLIAACREKNGMLKIYIDGQLGQGSYDAAHLNTPLAEGKTLVGSANGPMEVRDVRILSKALNFKEMGALMPKYDPFETSNLTKLGSLEGLLEKSTVGYGTLQTDCSVDGNTLTLRGEKYDFGVGVHATARIDVKVNGATRFVADLGIDDEASSAANHGIVTYSIIKDNDQTVMSGTITRTDKAPVHVDLDLSGWKTMTLMADAGAQNWGDHVDWAGAYFEYTDTRPVALTAGESLIAGIGSTATRQAWTVERNARNGFRVNCGDSRGQKKHASVFDADGRRLVSVKSKAESIDLNTPLQSGKVYVIRVDCGKLHADFKVLVE